MGTGAVCRCVGGACVPEAGGVTGALGAGRGALAGAPTPPRLGAGLRARGLAGETGAVRTGPSGRADTERATSESPSAHRPADTRRRRGRCLACGPCLRAQPVESPEHHMGADCSTFAQVWSTAQSAQGRITGRSRGAEADRRQQRECPHFADRADRVARLFAGDLTMVAAPARASRAECWRYSVPWLPFHAVCYSPLFL